MKNLSITLLFLLCVVSAFGQDLVVVKVEHGTYTFRRGNVLIEAKCTNTHTQCTLIGEPGTVTKPDSSQVCAGYRKGVRYLLSNTNEILLFTEFDNAETDSAGHSTCTYPREYAQDELVITKMWEVKK